MRSLSSDTRHELRALALLTGPILLSQFSQAAFGFIDTVMAGQVSALDLAAVALGSSLWLPLYLLTTGTLLAITPLIAAARGAGNPARIPALVHQGLWLSLLVTGCGFLILRLVPPLFDQLAVSPPLRAKTEAFLHAISWGMPAVGLFFVLRCYCEAQERPLPVTLISFAGLALNVAANQVFIHGTDGTALERLHIPAMGGPGCGWGTTTVLWSMALALFAYVMLSPHFAASRLLQSARKPDRDAVWRIARLGLPIGFAIFFEVSSFASVAVLVSPLGETVVAGHQVALSVTSILFMVPLSTAIALTIRTGEAWGARDTEALRRVARTGLWTTSVIALISAVFLLLGRHVIAAGYSDDAAVCALAADLMLFAVAYQVVDALQVGAAGCLRGMQDTRSPMRLTLIAYWVVGIPFGWLAGSTEVFGRAWGPYGYWAGLVLGLTVAALLLNRQLWRRLDRLPAA